LRPSGWASHGWHRPDRYPRHWLGWELLPGENAPYKMPLKAPFRKGRSILRRVLNCKMDFVVRIGFPGLQFQVVPPAIIESGAVSAADVSKSGSSCDRRQRCCRPAARSSPARHADEPQPRTWRGAAESSASRKLSCSTVLNSKVG
jgi:hypothetical protein